jgi:hypothetical protein
LDFSEYQAGHILMHGLYMLGQHAVMLNIYMTKQR